MEPEKEFEFLATEDFADGLHGALASGALERVAAPNLEDEVAPEGAHVAGSTFGRRGDEEDLGGRRFFGWRLRLGWPDDAVRDRGGLASGFVGVEAVVADGLLAFRWEVEQSGGDEVGGFEDLEVALSSVMAFDWYFSGDIEIPIGGSDPMTFRVSPPSADHLRGLISEIGAMLTGRSTFEKAEGWGGNHAWGPAFVLTHHIPEGWPRPDSTVHFVTDSIESAVTEAKTAAAGKSVGVHGADIIQQCLNAGLLDEFHVDIAAVLLGSGIRLFDHLVGTPTVLGDPTAIPGIGVTHLRYTVRKT